MPGLDDVNVYLVNSVDRAMDLFRWLGERNTAYPDILFVDTETTGLSPENDNIRLVQVGDETTGWAIPWHMWGGVFAELAAKWNGDNKSWGLHNAPFDRHFMAKEGVEIPTGKIFDTRPMAHVIDPTQSTALKNLSTRLVDSRAAGLQRQLDEAIGKNGGWGWHNVPIDFQPYWSYGALDPVLTAQIFAHFWPQVQREAPRAYEIENAVQWVIDRMERYGAHVDREYAVQTSQDFSVEAAQLVAATRAEYGFGLGSNGPLIAFFLEQGFNLTKKTKSGAALALDKEVLDSIAHPLAEVILRYRQLTKADSTYLSHFINDTDEAGLLHPSINTLGARTGRMSMSGPNLQNLPRRSETNKAGDMIRSCIDSRYPDGKLVMCDFDQIEMRLLAYFSQEPAMINAFISEGDFFVNLARNLFGDPTIQKKDPRRQITKNGGYATIYGAGVAKFAKTAGISMSESEAFFDRWNGMYPGVKAFQQLISQTAVRRREAEGTPWVRSPLSGRRHIADPGKEYALVNFLIQGTGAEVLKIKLIEADAAGLGDFMVVPVHDEIVCDVPPSDIEEVVYTLKKVMNDDEMFAPVPVSASVSYGDRWGEKIPWPGEDD